MRRKMTDSDVGMSSFMVVETACGDKVPADFAWWRIVSSWRVSWEARRFEVKRVTAVMREGFSKRSPIVYVERVNVVGC